MFIFQLFIQDLNLTQVAGARNTHTIQNYSKQSKFESSQKSYLSSKNQLHQANQKRFPLQNLQGNKKIHTDGFNDLQSLKNQRIINLPKLKFFEIFIIVICVMTTVLILLTIIFCCCVELEFYKCSFKKAQQNQQKKQVIKREFRYIKQRDWCVICLASECDLILQCSHYFHKQCFENWMLKNFCCPVCKYKQISQMSLISCMKCKKYCNIVKKQTIFNFRMDQQCCMNQQNNYNVLKMID